MSRNMTPAFETAMLEQQLRPALFFQGHFPSGTVRLWTGLGDIDWNGHTWIGGGNLIGVSDIEETTEVVAGSVTVTLSGVPTAYISLVMDDAQQGLAGRIYLALMDAAGNVIPDPVQTFRGRLDVPVIEDGAETCTISITYESRLVDLLTPREFRYTQESQQLFSPGDFGFAFITSLQDKRISWGVY